MVNITFERKISLCRPSTGTIIHGGGALQLFGYVEKSALPTMAENILQLLQRVMLNLKKPKKRRVSLIVEMKCRENFSDQSQALWSRKSPRCFFKLQKT